MLEKNELDILLKIKETSGSNDKQKILEENKDNQTLQQLLFYAFDPYTVFGLSSKKINKQITDIKASEKFTSVLEVCSYLAEHNTGRDRDIINVQEFINGEDEVYKQLLIDIFTKSLTIGTNISTINKVWKDLIINYEVQQAERLDQNIDKLLDTEPEVILTQKFDGQRGTARVENGNVKIFSRNGQVYIGLTELEEELSQLSDGIYDGELLFNAPDERNEQFLPKWLFKNPVKSRVSDDDFAHKNQILLHNSIIPKVYAPQPSKELFKATSSIVNSDDENKTNVNFWLYDMTPLENFDKMIEYKEPVEIRKEKLNMQLDIVKNVCPHLKQVPILYKGKFDDILIQAMLDEILLLQQEGLMLNICGAPYVWKRSKQMLKVKKMYPCDVRVTGIEEGSGKNKGKVGALIVDYKGFPVKVGSGLKDSERIMFWENKTLVIGKIITVQYFEETTNKKDNSLSLRFPIYKGLRPDKDEPSYN